MCNEYQRYVPLGIISDQFSQLKIPLRFPDGLPNLAPTSIRIAEIGTIIRQAQRSPAQLTSFSADGAGQVPGASQSSTFDLMGASSREVAASS